MSISPVKWLSALRPRWFDKEYQILKKANKLLVEINQLRAFYRNKPITELREVIDKIRSNLRGKEYNTEDPLYYKHVSHVTAITSELLRTIREEDPFNAQVIAGLCLNECAIIEMKTGQGKTLAAVLSAVFRCLYGGKMHIITVNDYLAKRDHDAMAPIFNAINITTGFIIKEEDDDTRISMYKADVVYISHHELGFDYLKSYIVYNANSILVKDNNMCQVIIDEIDSIIMDYARVPIIIGSNTPNQSKYSSIACTVIEELPEVYVKCDKKEHDVYITQEGISTLHQLIYNHFMVSIDEIYKIENLNILYYLDRALRAKYLFRKNYEYVVMNDKILVVDEYTGRVAKDRKFSAGIQQAIEAKEHLDTTNESLYVSYITTQNMYRKYSFISGMTGTIYTEKNEIEIVYNVAVVRVPRQEHDNVTHYRDRYFVTKEQKLNYIIRLIKERHSIGQPILIGTSSVQESEDLLQRLIDSGANIKCKLLNATRIPQEAEIIADAGTPYSVTIATNIAGRGTDISLGGSMESKIKQLTATHQPQNEQEVKELREFAKRELAISREKAMKAGGLLVIITQKQENRRIDNQLRGRTGRRSEFGMTMTFISLEDDDIFVQNNYDTSAAKMLVDDKVNGVHNILLESMSKKVQQSMEARAFKVRIDVLNQDHVLNKTRDCFSKIRDKILLETIDLKRTLEAAYKDLISIYKTNIDLFAKLCRQYILNDDEFEVHELILKNEIRRAYTQMLEIDFDEAFKKMKKTLLVDIDKIWSDYINSIEIVKRRANFTGKVDPLFDYSQHLCTAFSDYMQRHSASLFGRVYDYLHNFFLPAKAGTSDISNALLLNYEDIE